MSKPFCAVAVVAASALSSLASSPLLAATPAAPAASQPGMTYASIQHLPDFTGWYARIADGQLLVLQSNDYFACAEHVGCVPDLAAFAAQAPMRERLFEGAQRMRRYTRFMLIGRK